MGTARTPWAWSWRTTRSAARLVRQNTNACPWRSINLAVIATRSARSTFQKWWATSPFASAVASTATLTGFVLVAADDRLDLSPDGGGEEEDLAVGSRLVQQAAHRGEEPHVRHAVRLVEHDGGDVIEPDVAPLDEILESTRAGHHDVDPLVQGPHLVAVPRAAEDGHDPLAVMAQEVAQDVVDLRGQLPGRHQHQRPRAPRPRSAVLTARGIPKASVLPEPVGALPQMSRPAERGPGWWQTEW